MAVQRSERPVRERILHGTYACVARWGIGKTTVEDAAREAGVSRATLYRYFPGGRDELIDAVVLWQVTQFFAMLFEELHGAASLPEVLERAIVFARRAITEHQVLQQVMATEPELLLPKLTTERERIVGMVTGVLLPYLAHHTVVADVDMLQAADYLARMTLSVISAPGRWDLDDPDQVAEVVRVHLLAGIVEPGD